MAATKKRSVCIVGAGPSGLVTAKTLSQQGDYVVTVYEAADRVGGMWRAQPGEHGDKCSPEMKTNLSRFTVAFADLSWKSVDLSNSTVESSPVTPPMFPKAWQVGRYLETYMQKFALTPSIHLNKRVVKAELLDDSKTWHVFVEDTATKQQISSAFDHLVVASGFFDKPARSFNPIPSKESSNIQHSSRFRDLCSLTDKAGKIAVIGGGISGSEAAAQAAFQISNAQYSPGETKRTHTKSTIYHIINRPFYCLPRYLPVDPYKPETQDSHLAPKFLPLDLILYNLSRRGGGEISAAISTVPPDKAQKGHEFMRSVIGGHQRDFGRPELVYEQNQTQYPGYAGITDTYVEFVRSGLIVPIQGWVDEVKQHPESQCYEIALKQYDPWYHAPWNDAKSENAINDVAAIIEATGYKAQLDFLDPSIKEMLHYDASCARIPFLLTRGSILAEALPTIGFIGFYEGPYWGVMEMQARILADLWSKHEVNPGHFPERDLYRHDATERMRQAIRREWSLQVPQFWMADYVGIVEELAREAGIKRDDSNFEGQAGPIFPSRYRGTDKDSEAAIVLKEVYDTLKASAQNAKFVAAAVFRGMQGIWSLRRKIDSRNVSAPGGTFNGTAQFHPRVPTSTAFAAEYLYIEEGTFTMDTGYTFSATRRYVYRYNEFTDKITAWFTDENGVSVGALFNTWNFHAPDDAYHGWLADGYHWCDPDTYLNICEFRFRGASLQTFGITYQVEGPNKDYSHESWYERPREGYA